MTAPVHEHTIAGDSTVAVLDDQSARSLMVADFRYFEKTLGARPMDAADDDDTYYRSDHACYPHPSDINGLPAGWSARWSTRYPSRDGQVRHEAFVVERLSGGWSMVFHLQPDKGFQFPKTNLWGVSSSTLRGLYERALSLSRASVVQLDEAGAVEVEQYLRDFIREQFDPSNPEEAAEAVLAAFGSPLTTFPASLV